MKLKYILILVLAFSLGACKKITHTDTSIKGKVNNQTDNTPLIGYSVYLQERETPFSATEPPVSTTLDSRTTDSNGEFDFGEWELKKRSKFRYFVVFDDNDELFMSDQWQSGNYINVEREKEVFRGENIYLILPQVKAAYFRLNITNNSTYALLKFSVIARNSKYEDLAGDYEVKQGEDYQFDIFSGSVAGDLILEYLIRDNNSNIIDTVYQEIFVPHNENTEIYFTYPPQ